MFDEELDTKPAHDDFAPRFVGHDLSHLQSLGSGTVAGGGRLQSQVVGTTEPFEIIIEPPCNRRCANRTMLWRNDQEELMSARYLNYARAKPGQLPFCRDHR